MCPWCVMRPSDLPGRPPHSDWGPRGQILSDQAAVSSLLAEGGGGLGLGLGLVCANFSSLLKGVYSWMVGIIGKQQHIQWHLDILFGTLKKTNFLKILWCLYLFYIFINNKKSSSLSSFYMLAYVWISSKYITTTSADHYWFSIRNNFKRTVWKQLLKIRGPV